MKLPSDVTLRRLAYDDARASAWAAWLSKEEQARWQAFPSRKRRREFLLGRAAARQAVGARLGVAPKEAPLSTAADGAVDVASALPEDCFVSISHAEGCAVAAAAPRPVGIDLERVRVRRPGIRRFVLHPDEEGLLARLPFAEERGLVLVWAIKEAVLKARRSGLRVLPTRLRLDFDLAAGRADAYLGPEETWRAAYDAEGPFCCAVAFR